MGHKELDTTERLPLSLGPQASRWRSGKEHACHTAVARDAGLTSGLEEPLKEEMATYSRILAWKIPWTEKPDTVYGVTKNWILLNTHEHDLLIVYFPSIF